MSGFISKKYAGMAPYVPGEQPKYGEYIKLNTNESPYPPAPGVLEAIRSDEASRLNLYNDMEAKELTAEIARFYSLRTEQVSVGNGSDEILAFCFMAFCDGEIGACYPNISYGFYKVYARLFGLEAKAVPLKADFTLSASDYFNAGRTIFIANPNAPTGISLELADIESILQNNRKNVVVIDEAYVDFGGESAVSLIPAYENLVVVQTFSKARNLAGGRIGFAMAQKPLIDDLKLIKYSFHPYNLNTLSQLAGVAAMRDAEYFRQCTGKIVAARQWTKDELERRGFSCTDSKANFLFAKSDRITGAPLYERLKEKKILIRYFDSPGIDDHVRVTVGTHEQMRAVIAAIDEIFSEISG